MQPTPFWTIFDAIVGAHGDRPCLVSSSAHHSYDDVAARARRLAGFLSTAGLGCHTEREGLRPHESGQDHVGICLGNRVEYIETMFGALRARSAPANVNYRYVSDELAHLVTACGIRAFVYDVAMAETIADLVERVGPFAALVEVGGTEVPALDGAVAYEAIVGADAPSPALPEPRPEDLIVVCTGGTTGLPKAVLWSQSDMLNGIMGKTHTVTGRPVVSVDDLVTGAETVDLRCLSASPLMHFAGLGMAMMLATCGATLVLADPPTGFDPAAVLAMVEREKVNLVSIVGDAFGAPLAAEAASGRYDLSSLAAIGSGGAVLTSATKARLNEVLDGKVVISEGLGSSEAGLQAQSAWAGTDEPGVFAPSDATAILNEERTQTLDPVDGSTGWLATRGFVPFGYLGDEVRTASTFPMVDGVRYSVPGDFARWRPDGRIDLLGREATTINTGGEKVFAPEVEAALLHHPSIAEAVVLGRMSPKWGQEVVAIVVPAVAAEEVDLEALLEEASKHIARYKLPKAVVVTEAIDRTATGKVDYRWAKAMVSDADR